MRALLASLVLLCGCATAATSAPANIPLAGTEWQRVDDENANPHGATIAFTERGASGDTGCNRWFAAVTHDGETLRFGNVGMTRMACQAEVQAATERNFLAALGATRYVRTDNGALVFLDENRREAARFENMREP